MLYIGSQMDSQLSKEETMMRQKMSEENQGNSEFNNAKTVMNNRSSL